MDMVRSVAGVARSGGPAPASPPPRLGRGVFSRAWADGAGGMCAF